jgi:hypothetical protein
MEHAELARHTAWACGGRISSTASVQELAFRNMNGIDGMRLSNWLVVFMLAPICGHAVAEEETATHASP